MTVSSPLTISVADAYRQSEAILALEGLHPDPTSLAIQEAVIAGRVTGSQAVAEMCEYAKTHQTLEGFIQSRQWA